MTTGYIAYSLQQHGKSYFMSRRNGTFCPKVGEMGVGETGVGEQGPTEQAQINPTNRSA